MPEIKELTDRLAAGNLTAIDALEQTIERIEARDAELNAVVVRDFDRARGAAAAADERLARGERAPLLGLPMTVKESFDIAGLPSTWGRPEARDNIASADSRVVRRLKGAGAVILGKTNIAIDLADFQSNNEVYGATNNPYMVGRSSGGSSGGSAAALGAGYVPAEVGTDIGGSVRLPAAFCGIWGLKTTYGLVSLEGHSHPGTDGAARPLSVAGPMARTAEDVELLLSIIGEHPLPGPTRKSTAGARLAVIDTHPVGPIDSDVARVIDETCARAEAAGYVVDRSPRLPNLAEMHQAYIKMLLTVLSRGVAPEGVPPITLSDWFDLQDQQALFARAWNLALTEKCDGVLAPVFGTTAFEIDDIDMSTRKILIDGTATACGLQLAWAGLATYPNLPSISFPAGKGSDGLPIGLQLIGPHFGDRDVLALAKPIAI
ncbi:MAG: amidase family protein [Cumulibacter sp.]